MYFEQVTKHMSRWKKGRANIETFFLMICVDVVAQCLELRHVCSSCYCYMLCSARKDCCCFRDDYLTLQSLLISQFRHSYTRRRRDPTFWHCLTSYPSHAVTVVSLEKLVWFGISYPRSSVVLSSAPLIMSMTWNSLRIRSLVSAETTEPLLYKNTCHACSSADCVRYCLMVHVRTPLFFGVVTHSYILSTL